MKVKSIAILGIGGVGGFLGAKILSNRKNDEIKIDFISRGTTYDNIKSKGLLFTSPEKEEVLMPDGLILSGEGNVAYDLVILATKSQSMESAIIENKSIFGENTLVLPLQNMVNAAQSVRTLLEKSEVLDACIYLISNVLEPGHIKHLGGPGKVIIGKPSTDKYNWAFEFLAECEVPLSLVDDVNTHLWKKFLFISSLGTLSAAYDVNFGDIRTKPELIKCWRSLMAELILLAQKHGIALGDSDIEAAFEMISNFPHTAKSSFQLDIERGIKGEKETLVDEVIKKSHNNDLACPVYIELEEKISKRLSNVSATNT
jgi:2-dehydropantoate 2-reductase